MPFNHLVIVKKKEGDSLDREWIAHSNSLRRIFRNSLQRCDLEATEIQYLRAGKVKETLPTLRKHTLAQRETWREPLLEPQGGTGKGFK